MIIRINLRRKLLRRVITNPLVLHLEIMRRDAKFSFTMSAKKQPTRISRKLLKKLGKLQTSSILEEVLLSSPFLQMRKHNLALLR